MSPGREPEGREKRVEHFLSTFKPYLDHYGYFAIFGALFLEDFGVPMPGETLLIAGALLATHGSLNIYLVVATAWCAAVLGDNLGYAIGRFGGRLLVLRYGKYVLLTPERFAYAERFFHKRGPIIVVVARFFEILRQLNGIVAGAAGMEWWRFLLYNSAGAAMWVGFWSLLFFQLGRQGERLGFLFKRYEPAAIALLVVVAAALVILRFLRKKHRPEAPPSQAPER